MRTCGNAFPKIADVKRGFSSWKPLCAIRIDEHRNSLMLFDYQEITLYTGKDTPNLAHLTPIYRKPSWDWYRLDSGVNPLKVGYSEPLRELVIKGSMPYFNQGHNAAHSLRDLRDNWKYVGELLRVNPFNAVVTAFECGAIIATSYPPSVLLEHHIHLPTYETRTFQNKTGKLTGKEFISSALKVKLYSPLDNYREKRLTKAKYSSLLGVSPEGSYLKIENHYRKPERYFKKMILLTDFFNPAYQQLFKTDLMDTYRKITKTKAVAIPSDKASLSTGNLILLTLKSIALEYGLDAEECIKEMLSRVPPEVLTRDDRKARKKHLRKMLKEVGVEGSDSPFDLSEPLLRALTNYD